MHYQVYWIHTNRDNECRLNVVISFKQLCEKILFSYLERVGHIWNPLIFVSFQIKIYKIFVFEAVDQVIHESIYFTNFYLILNGYYLE